MPDVAAAAWVIFLLAPSLVDVNVISWAAVIEAVTLTPAADKLVEVIQRFDRRRLGGALKATAVAPTGDRREHPIVS